MNARNAAYWTSTTIIFLGFLSNGVACLLRVEAPAKLIAELGYPPYFLTILGAWKVLGALALLAPGLPRVKEWAYAGIVFNLTGAAFSHAACGHPVGQAAVPLVLAAIAVASWALRPASRVLGALRPEPEHARMPAPALARTT
jgi:uncharacterized membrane protein YphA (DoxX/SURF4 family)